MGGTHPDQTGREKSQRRLLFSAVGVAVLAVVAWIAFPRDRGRDSSVETIDTNRSAPNDDASATRSHDRSPDRASKNASPALHADASRELVDQAAVEPPSASAVSADETDPLNEVKAAALDGSGKSTEKLVASLSSTDSVVVAEAAKALIERRATNQIAALAKLDLTSAAGGGLSIIDALGKLGTIAGPDEKTIAVERLIAMLAEEKRRHAPESASNLIQIYEALGETRDPRAEKPLDAELLDASVGRAPKVVIVNALIAIGSSGSRDSLAEARSKEATARPSDAFEEELRVELLAAIDKALAEL